MNRKNGERKKNEGRVEVGQSVDRVKKETSVMVDVIFARRSGLKRLIFFTPTEYFNYRFLYKETKK